MRKILALKLVELCSKAFADGSEPPTDQLLADRLHAPVRLVRGILYDLTAAGVLNSVRHDDRPGERFQPGMRLELLTISKILQALDLRGGQDLPPAAAADLQNLTERLDAFDNLIAESAKNVAVVDL